MKFIFLLLAFNSAYAESQKNPDFICKESKLSPNSKYEELKVTHIRNDPGGAGYNATFLVELKTKNSIPKYVNFYFELDHMDYFSEVNNRRLSHKIWANVLDYENNFGVLKLTKDNHAILKIKDAQSDTDEMFQCIFYNGY